MKTNPLYPIASPWLICDEQDRVIADPVKFCDGQHTIEQIGKAIAGQGRRMKELMRLGERLGVIALATEDMPFLNAWYANEFGALLFEGAKIHGTSPSAYLSVIKRHLVDRRTLILQGRQADL